MTSLFNFPREFHISHGVPVEVRKQARMDKDEFSIVTNILRAFRMEIRPI